MEGNSWLTSRRSRRHTDGFTDLVFSWSLEEIFDENLYLHQVEKIPESFESVDEYLGSYVYPLLEETRYELASALETIYSAPFAEVKSFEESIREAQVYKVKVDRWDNRSVGGKEPYRTLPGDFVLVSAVKPENVSDLLLVGCTYTFASVRKIYEDESGDQCTSSGFKIVTARSIEVDQKSKSLYVVHLANLTTQKRIWNALGMRRNLRIIDRVLIENDLGKENCETCPLKCHREVEEKFGSNLLAMLNESQRGAILASLQKIGCSHQSSVELIWGPPGTGKTLTLSCLLYILLKMNVRTLICAPTNIAITQLASKVAELVRNSFKTGSQESHFSCPLGDMLIFGNKDNLKVGSNIQEIFLDYRVERLIECLVPLTGWKHCVSSMLDFLEHCVSQYQIFVGNELIKAKECIRDDSKQSEGEECLNDDSKQSASKSFLEFARDRFTHVASPLRQCLFTLFTHLPRSSLQEENYQSTVQLFPLLESLEKLLFEDDSLTSNDLETIFSPRSMSGSEFPVDTLSLEYIKNQCLSILRSLRDSLSKLGLPLVTAKTSTMEFCFQKASVTSSLEHTQ